MLPSAIYEPLPFAYMGSGLLLLGVADHPGLLLAGLAFYLAGSLAWFRRSAYRRPDKPVVRKQGWPLWHCSATNPSAPAANAPAHRPALQGCPDGRDAGGRHFIVPHLGRHGPSDADAAGTPMAKPAPGRNNASLATPFIPLMLLLAQPPATGVLLSQATRASMPWPARPGDQTWDFVQPFFRPFLAPSALPCRAVRRWAWQPRSRRSRRPRPPSRSA